MELVDRDGFARRGRFETPHGTLETPALLPVVHPEKSRQTVAPQELAETFGFRGVITSSYILRRVPELRERARAEGLHRFLEFPGVIMTDSGAFQQHSQGRVDATPAEMLEFQEAVGSDIATVLDEFVEPEASFEEARRGVETTLERAAEARRRRGDRLLAVPVQGGLFPELRSRSAEGSSPLADVLAVGGIVPLMEHYRYADLARVLLSARPHLAPERAVHLFGLGHPMLFALGALFGGDLFDSSSYHKFARRDTLLFPEGSLLLSEVREEICGCALCAKVPLTQLSGRPAPERERHLARHNLDQCVREMARVRQAIRDGEIWELAERRSTAHPALAAAMEVARGQPQVFAPVEPPSRRSFRVVLPGSRERPAVRRFHERLRGWRRGRPSLGLVGPRPLSPSALRNAPKLTEGLQGTFDVETPLGRVPLELTEIYPVGPLVAPEQFAGTTAATSFYPSASASKVEESGPSDPEEVARQWASRHAAGVMAWSYGWEAAEQLQAQGWRIVHSRHTGRLRQIYLGELQLFVVGNDGLPRPTFAGASWLHRTLPRPRLRVQAHPEAAPFVEQGRSLFSRHVVASDPTIVPDQEVLVVDQQDRLLAVGRSLLAAGEMGRMPKGVAVRPTAHARGRAEEEEASSEERPVPGSAPRGHAEISGELRRGSE